MFKKNRVGFIVNFSLIIIVIIVFSVCFIPEKIMPIYGGKNIAPIYYGNKSEKCVSIMINVYESKENVEKIVDIFDSFNVKGTFFVGGCWADDNESTLQYIVSHGHELGNHGYFHKDHAKLSYEKNKEEIMLAEKIVYALCGTKTRLFAPPSGSYSDNTLSACDDMEYKVIMWSKDTIDWRDSDTQLIFNRATKNLSNGDLILMHPKNHTVTVLPEIIAFYLSMGYNVCSVSENVGI